MATPPKGSSQPRKRTSADRSTREPETHFLNVDLDVRSREGLEELVAAFGGHDLYCGKVVRSYLASFEVHVRSRRVEPTIRALVRRAASLRGRAKELWEKASHRDFNIGFQAGEGPHSYEAVISNETLQAVAALGGRIVVTIYGARVEKPVTGRHPSA
jgi:hypothetical protein